MKDNNIEIMKNKYFFIGFIVGIIPFVIVLTTLSTNRFPSIFKMTLIIVALITATINGYILRYNIILKAKRSLI